MKLSQEELRNNQLSPETVEYAVEQIRVNGYIVFESVIPLDLIDVLRTEYMQMFQRLLQDPGKTFGVEHYGMSVPFAPPFSDERVIANPLVIPILEQLLGTDFVNHNLLSNTCMPGSGYQDTHSDVPALYPELPNLYLPPYMIVLNIPLVAMTEENGATEIWPGGTHYMTLPNDRIATLKQNMLSMRTEMPAGSIMMRDARMWHNGTPNRSDKPRQMLAMTYQRPWFGGRGGTKRIGIPKETYDGLSARAKQIYRLENIGGPLDTEFSHRDSKRQQAMKEARQ
jgi:hypothetical protein